MARPELSTCFEHTLLPHGGDGKRVRAVIVRCGKCGTGEPMPINTMANGGSQTDEVEWKYIARRMERKNWEIGRRRQDHRCPRCLNVIKLASADAPPPTPAKGNLKLVRDVLMSTAKTPPQPAPATATEPRAMTRDDRRIIFEKLNEVYLDEKRGYSDGWSDEKVATHLGVPRAWVSTIRDENFGEEITSEATRTAIKEARVLLVAISKYRSVIADAVKELQPLYERADKIERTLAEIAKVTK